jgi:hypothetical protein
VVGALVRDSSGNKALSIKLYKRAVERRLVASEFLAAVLKSVWCALCLCGSLCRMPWCSQRRRRGEERRGEERRGEERRGEERRGEESKRGLLNTLREGLKRVKRGEGAHAPSPHPPDTLQTEEEEREEKVEGRKGGGQVEKDEGNESKRRWRRSKRTNQHTDTAGRAYLGDQRPHQKAKKNEQVLSEEDARHHMLPLACSCKGAGCRVWGVGCRV